MQDDPWDAYLKLDVEGDYVGALAALESLARGGSVEAMFLLGQELGVYSRTGAADYSQAAHWFRLASEAGDLCALYEYGVALALGLGVERNVEYARELIRTAADGGNSLAIEAVLGELPSLHLLDYRHTSAERDGYEELRRINAL